MGGNGGGGEGGGGEGGGEGEFTAGGGGLAGGSDGGGSGGVTALLPTETQPTDASVATHALARAAGSADMAESKRDCVPSPRALAKALLSRMVVCTSIAVVCGCCTVSALSGTPISLAIYEVATFGAASGAPSASCRTAEKTA
jgi:hypothetical protein